MILFTVENAVFLALFQTGTIVLGTLTAGAVTRVCDSAGYIAAAPTVFMVCYGWLLLVLPLIWIACAMRLRMLSRVPEGVKAGAFLAGILQGALLFGFSIYATWRGFFFSLPGGPESL
jgi:hypothetical protein